MKKSISIGTLTILLSVHAVSCYTSPLQDEKEFMRGFDASTVSQTIECGGKYRNSSGREDDVFKILKENGINWTRLRVWHSPSPETAGNNSTERTVETAREIKRHGLKYLLDIHYSDTWADPSSQVRPAAWNDVNTIDGLCLKVSEYTEDLLSALKGFEPDMVQIGNEINPGMFLTLAGENPEENPALPHCSSFASDESARNLGKILQSAAKAVRTHNRKICIMVHLASDRGTDPSWWFKKFTSYSDGSSEARVLEDDLDFDAIGLSYYPYYDHGTLDELKSNIRTLKSNFSKEVVVVETAWAWTDLYADGTTNLFGESHKVQGFKNLFPYTQDMETQKTEDGTGLAASVKNQKKIIKTILNEVKKSGGSGLFYWGGDWIPVDKIKNNWENQALFSFDGTALESLGAFSN